MKGCRNGDQGRGVLTRASAHQLRGNEANEMNKIRGRVAVVTGGTQGLGAAIVELFAEAGAAGIVIVGRGLEKGRALAKAISAKCGVPVEMAPADPISGSAASTSSSMPLA